MANNDFKQSINQAKSDIDSLIPHLQKVEAQVLKVSKNIRKNMAGAFKGTPNGANSSIQKQLAELKAFNSAMKAQRKEEERAISAEKAANDRRLKNLTTFQERMQAQRKKEEAENAKSVANAKKHNAEIQKSVKKAQDKRLKDLTSFQLAMAKQKKKELAATDKLIKKNAQLAAKNKHLARSYVQLQAKTERSRKALQDMVATGRRAGESQSKFNKRIARARKEFRGYTAQIRKANGATKRYSSGGLKGMMGGMSSLVGGFGVLAVVQGLKSLGTEVFNQTKKLQSLEFTMKAVTDGSAEFLRTNEFLERITMKYGTSLVATTERYTKFLAAAKQSNLAMGETEKIFDKVTKAGAVMGLKTDELSGVYLALEQMLSKGKVTTEELRRQLGERLPGAFGIMADAVGVSTSELDKMLKKGQILSAEILPKFAEQLEKAYGLDKIQNIETVVASQNRLNTSWTLFIKHIDEGDNILSKFFINILEGLSATITGFDDLVESSESLWDFTKKIAKAGFGGPAGAANVMAEASAQAMVNREMRKKERIYKQLAILQINDEKKHKKLTLFITEEEEIERRKLGLMKLTSKQMTDQIEALQKKLKLESGEDGGDASGATVDDDGKPLPQKGSIAYLEKIIAANQEIISLTTSGAKRQATIAENIELQKQVDLLTAGKHERQTAITGKASDAGSANAINRQIEALQKLKNLESDPAAITMILAEIKALEKRKLILESGGEEQYNQQQRILKAMDEYAAKLAINAQREEDIEEKRLERLDNLAQKLQMISQIAGAGSDLAAAFADRRIQKIEEEQEAADEQFEADIEHAEATAQSDEELALKKEVLEQEKARKDEQLQKKINKEKEKQAKVDKAAALVQAGIGTALAIIAALSTQPFLPLGPSMAILAGVLGGIQIAAIAAAPIPKFAEGTENHKGGPAILGDGGKAELAILPDGSMFKSASKDTLYDLPSGTKVKPDFDAEMKKMMGKEDVFNSDVMRRLIFAELEKKYDKQILDAIQQQTEVLRSKKFNESKKSERVDLAHELYRMRSINWNA